MRRSGSGSNKLAVKQKVFHGVSWDIEAGYGEVWY